MAYTGAQLVADALQEAGVYGQGETPNAADMQLCLRKVNRLIATFSALKSLVFGTYNDSLVMTPGTATYNFTSFPLGRPLNLESLYLTLSNVSYPIRMIDAGTYSNIPVKTVTGIPVECWLNWTATDGSLTFYPIPIAAYTMNIVAWTTFQGTVDINTVFALPPGYETFLTEALAVDVAPSFGMPVSEDARVAAVRARRSLRMVNYQPPRMYDITQQDYDPSTGFIYKGF